MTIALALAGAILPPLVVLWIVYRHDVFPEPPAVVWTCFLLGMAIVVPILIVAGPTLLIGQTLLTGTDPWVLGFLAAFFGAAIPEEFFKFLVLRYYAATHRAFNEPMDGMVYGVAVSLGFATLENVLYAVSLGFSFLVVLMRALTAIPMHAALGAIMGWYVSQWRFRPTGRTRSVVLALVVPIILHGLYDWPLLAAAQVKDSVEEPNPLLLLGSCGLPIVLLIVMVRGVYKMMRQMRAVQVRHREAGGIEGYRSDGTPLG